MGALGLDVLIVSIPTGTPVISAAAKDLVSRVLKPKPTERLSLEGMLQHEWLVKVTRRNELAQSMLSREPSLALGRDSIPADFFCPLSKDIMLDPVRDAQGTAYDRDSIEKVCGMC